MSRNGILVLALLAPSGAFCLMPGDDRIMARGDANNSHRVDMTDACMINNWLFSGGPAPPCMNQADANDDGRVDVSDSTFILNWLFMGGPAPPSPGPFNQVCTLDAGTRPGCNVNPCY